MGGGITAGGSRALAELIDKYGGAIFPDLLERYGVDLRDLFRDESDLDPRTALSLVNHLSFDSAYIAELRGGPQFRGWNADRYLNVAQVNAQRALLHSYILTHTGKGKKPKAPEPYPIPQEPRDKAPHKPKAGSFGGIVATMMAASRKAKREMQV